MSHDRQASADQESPAPESVCWHFRLYVTGVTPAGEAALENLKSACDEFLEGRYTLDVIDLFEDISQAEADHIFAIPTVVRVVPMPRKKVIGDLSDRVKLIAAMGIPTSTKRSPIRDVGPGEG